MQKVNGLYLNPLTRFYASMSNFIQDPKSISSFAFMQLPNKDVPVQNLGSDTRSKTDYFKKTGKSMPHNKKACLLPSSLSFYSTHPAYFDILSLLNEIFQKIAPISSMNLSKEDISYILLIDIPLAIRFPSELPKTAKNKSPPNFSIIYSLNSFNGNSPSDGSSIFSLRNLLSQELMSLWKPSKEMEKILGCPLTERMYHRLCLKLALVYTLNQHCPSSNTLSDFLAGWKKANLSTVGGISTMHSEYRLRETDSIGRTFTTGTKKCAKAELWLYPMCTDTTHLTSIYERPSSTFPVFVNGRPMHIYFEGDIKKMISLISPLELTHKFNTYCVWASVGGGGMKGNNYNYANYTGRADAIKIALARALASREPLLLPLLESIVKGDGRRVERKKYGQPKARRQFTWVKR